MNDEREAIVAKIKQIIEKEIDFKVKLQKDEIDKLRNVLYDDVARICDYKLYLFKSFYLSIFQIIIFKDWNQ